MTVQLYSSLHRRTKQVSSGRSFGEEGGKEESGNAVNVLSRLGSIVIVLKRREEAYMSAPAASAAS